MGKRDSDNEDFSSPIPTQLKNIEKHFCKENQSSSPSQKQNVTNPTIVPSEHLRQNSYIKSMEEYSNMYNESVQNASEFWTKMAADFHFKPTPGLLNEISPVFDYNFDPRKGPMYTHFMKGYLTNISWNVLDRHILAGKGENIAFYWEGNYPEDSFKITYSELHERVCKFSNALKSLGVQKGDVVAIYMPMVLELVVAMLGSNRIGAIHSVVFAGYSAQALSDRLVDGKVKVLITADGSWRGKKFMALKEICDDALVKADQFHHVEHVIVLRHLERLHNYTKQEYIAPSNPPTDKDWEHFVENQSAICPPEWVDSEHPMFILYTSGSTGKPKGIVHATGGYMVFSSTVFKYSFDFHPETDLFWGTADLGWLCAQTNSVYGTLSLGGSSVIFEGNPSERPFSIIEKYAVSVFYTAPTLLRHLMSKDTPGLKYKRRSLRVLGTVGEPINASTWHWYHSVCGGSKCPIVDTYGQTETGGHLLTTIAGVTPTKPGAVGLPFFGSVPALLTFEGKEIEGAGEGCLVFKQPWPCIARTVHGDRDRYVESYFNRFPGYYCTGDAARRDEDGFYYVTGRIDDMLNISGHLISISSIETAILEHEDVAEVAVVAVPHAIKGQTLYAFVLLKNKADEDVAKRLQQKVREKIGSFAVPEAVIKTTVLPMTSSGKILRRVLFNIVLGNTDLGDTSTLIDISVLDALKQIMINNPLVS